MREREADRQTDRDRETERQRQRDRDTERVNECACVEYNIMTILFIYYYGFFDTYIIVDLVKRGMLKLVGEIRRYRNDRYYYYY